MGRKDANLSSVDCSESDRLADIEERFYERGLVQWHPAVLVFVSGLDLRQGPDKLPDCTH